MEGKELQHFFHEHPLILKAEEHITNGGNDHPEKEINCDGCLLPISGPFYSCGVCRYFLHKVCAELPSSLDHPLHPKHPLALLECAPYEDGDYFCDFCKKRGSGLVYHCSVCSFDMDTGCAFPTYKIKDTCHPHPLTPIQVPTALACHICRVQEKGLFYKCDVCPFLVHQNCTAEHSDHDHPYPFRVLQHFFHKHPLILKGERSKADGDNNHPMEEIKCSGCQIPISGPFYSCGECPYFLHKVCAELPKELNHPLHPEHPLTLLELSARECDLCKEDYSYEGPSRVMYYCSICKFKVDMKCSSATQVIYDKCHPHPLTPVQVPIVFDCHNCLKKEEGLSYKCNICPFWVHQNCTLLPDKVKHSDHRHLLTLLPSVPANNNHHCRRCDICYSKLFMFQSTYSCVGCLFFAHVGCARSETIQSTSRDQNTDGQSLIYLPMKQDSTDWISQFVKKTITSTSTISNIDNKIDHFDHEHPLLLIDEKTSDNKTCEACAGRITPPSYGCVDCDYFLHKCCTDLPKQIQDHALHPQHQLTLQSAQRVLWCYCCGQYCNSFIYKCFVCYYFEMDIKCGSILDGAVVYHEAHKHPLFSSVKPSSTCCTACGSEYSSNILKCDTCSFVLCFKCAMAPAVIKHRYGGKAEEPFRLTYSTPENHHYEDEYLCEMCQKELNPKGWYYHCLFADQFAHVRCMVDCGADSNIKYGKSHMEKYFHEEHEVTTISRKYDCSPCSSCRHPMRITPTLYFVGGGGGGCVGYECKTCNYRCHLTCPSDEDSDDDTTYRDMILTAKGG